MTPEPSTSDVDLFDGKKKKKKKSKDSASTTTTAVESPETKLDTEAVTEEFQHLKLKKKKKKHHHATTDANDFDKELEKAGIVETTGKDDEKTNISSQQELPYEFLLSRFFTILRKNNPELANEKGGIKFKIPPPEVHKDGKKSVFANVEEIAERMQRSPDHVIQYLFVELGTSGSIDAQKRLIIKGRFLQKQLENVLRRYIGEYVTCKTCKSVNTTLKKENRLYFLICNSCGSTRTVSSIKAGFQAQMRRKKY